MKFIIRPQFSALLSYLGMTASVAGLFLTLKYGPHTGLLCLIFATICDLFDGTFARRFKRTDFEKRFGIHIDSLADVLNFVALPVFLIIFMMDGSLWSVPLIILYAGCGVTRLAVFSAEADAETSKRYFRGVPAAYVALLLPLIYIAQAHLGRGAGLFVCAAPVCRLSILFVLDIRVRRPGLVGYIVILLLAVALSAGVLYAGV